METPPKVTQLLVVDAERRLVGALHLHDLFRAQGGLMPATDLMARARRVRLLSCDVDGVLTDGSIYVDGGRAASSRRTRASTAWA